MSSVTCYFIVEIIKKQLLLNGLIYNIIVGFQGFIFEKFSKNEKDITVPYKTGRFRLGKRNTLSRAN